MLTPLIKLLLHCDGKVVLKLFGHSRSWRGRVNFDVLSRNEHEQRGVRSTWVPGWPFNNLWESYTARTVTHYPCFSVFVTIFNRLLISRKPWSQKLICYRVLMKMYWIFDFNTLGYKTEKQTCQCQLGFDSSGCEFDTKTNLYFWHDKSSLTLEVQSWKVNIEISSVTVYHVGYHQWISLDGVALGRRGHN